MAERPRPDLEMLLAIYEVKPDALRQDTAEAIRFALKLEAKAEAAEELETELESLADEVTAYLDLEVRGQKNYPDSLRKNVRRAHRSIVNSRAQRGAE